MASVSRINGFDSFETPEWCSTGQLETVFVPASDSYRHYGW
jgi:hypothetical protein